MNNTKMSDESTLTQPVKVLYTAKAHTTGGREGGASRTSDGRLDVKLSVPGTPGNGTQSGAVVCRWLVRLFHKCYKDCSRENEGEAPVGYGHRLRSGPLH